MSVIDPNQAITLTFRNGTSFQVIDEDLGESRGEGPVREVWSWHWLEGRAEWNIRCDWKDRLGIAAGFFGGTTIIDGKPAYSLPANYPYSNAWIAKQIEVRGVGLMTADGPSGISQPKYARLKLKFGPPDWTPNSGTMLGELEIDTSQSAVAMDPTSPAFVWADATNVSPSQVPSIRVTTLLASLKLYNRGSLNTSLYQSLVDCTNSGSFLGFATETMILRGIRSDRVITMGGILNYNLTLLWEILPGNGSGGVSNPTWNMLFRPKNGSTNSQWTSFTLTDGTTKRYPPVDFNQLLV